jgi:hypothetical protein
MLFRCSCDSKGVTHSNLYKEGFACIFPMDVEDLNARERRVIQIEDDPGTQKIFKEFFDSAGINLIQAGSKSEFFRLAHLEADLYVLDRHFPATPDEGPNDISWREVAGALSTIYPEKPAILLSAYPPAEREWRQYRSIREVMQKPVLFSELILKVRGYLNGE